MKPMVACALLALTLVPAVEGLQARAAAPQSAYLLVCRGGGDLHFSYTPSSNLSPEPQVWITFSRAPGAVGANWENLGVLQAGQCGWLDRAVSEGEPNQIALMGVARFAIQWQRGQVAGISSELPQINALQDPGRYQSFHVTNNGKGFLVVQKVGESR